MPRGVVTDSGAMDALSAELFPGESVLWTGTPVRPPLLSKYDAPLVAFMAVWLMFVSSFLVATSRDTAAPGFVRIVPLAMIAIGLFNLYGVTLGRRLRILSTQYAVTSRRVISASTRPRRCVSSAYLWQLPPPVVTDESGMRGSVVFGRSSFGVRVAARWSTTGQTSRRRRKFQSQLPAPFELEYVQNARSVRDLIAKQQQQLGPAGLESTR